MVSFSSVQGPRFKFCWVQGCLECAGLPGTLPKGVPIMCQSCKPKPYSSHFVLLLSFFVYFECGIATT